MRMKRKPLHILLLTLVFLIVSCVSAFGMEQRVFDYADLLDETDEQEMHLWVEDLRENWGLDLAFLTTNDTEGKTVQEYGADFYIAHNLGMGESYDGVIFVLDMGTREGQILTSGKAIDIYTDYYIDKMWENMVDELSDGDYYWAFYSLYMDLHHYAEEYEAYLADPEGYVSEYEQEQEGSGSGEHPLLRIAFALVFGLIVAVLVVASMKCKMNNVKPFTDGRAYLKENGCHFTVDRSNFAGTHTTVVPIPKDDDKKGGSWGGGSSSFSRGGRSFGGGGGKF